MGEVLDVTRLDLFTNWEIGRPSRPSGQSEAESDNERSLTLWTGVVIPRLSLKGGDANAVFHRGNILLPAFRWLPSVELKKKQ